MHRFSEVVRAVYNAVLFDSRPSMMYVKLEFYVIIDFVLALAEFSITNSMYCSDHFPFVSNS